MRLARSILILLALAWFATACSNGPASGTVVDRRYEDSYAFWVAGVDIAGSCTMIGNVQSCTSGIHIPGHEQYVPESWSLKTDDGEHSGWRDVHEHEYDSCLPQDHYPECAGP